jgi:hypothetical protein
MRIGVSTAHNYPRDPGSPSIAMRASEVPGGHSSDAVGEAIVAIERLHPAAQGLRLRRRTSRSRPTPHRRLSVSGCVGREHSLTRGLPAPSRCLHEAPSCLPPTCRNQMVVVHPKAACELACLECRYHAPPTRGFGTSARLHKRTPGSRDAWQPQIGYSASLSRRRGGRGKSPGCRRLVPSGLLQKAHHPFSKERRLAGVKVFAARKIQTSPSIG